MYTNNIYIPISVIRVIGANEVNYNNMAYNLYLLTANKYSQSSSCDHLSSATSFPKDEKVQITIFGTSCKATTSRKRPRPLLELKV